MSAISDRDKRTLRLASIGIAGYLLIFFCFRGWKHFESGNSQYQQLVQQSGRLRREIQPYESRVLLVQKLKGTLHLDPAKLAKATVVSEASAAIQKAAKTGGIQVGPIRESAAHSGGRELTSMQLEGAGQATAVLGLFHRLETLGYPVVIDSVQITPDMRPGMVKFNLTIVILDFEQWKKEEKSNA